ncbi:MAG TPA: hypothetical protein VJQ50_15705 [Terriglobales bacterium]|nr:hypothetical protein [Terriglobales bacterium]
MRRHFGFILCMLLVPAAWGQQMRQLTVSPALPAASGTMGVSRDASGTTYISLHVKHLANSDELHPAKAAYVVWVQPPGQPAQNHGVLQVNDKQEATYSTTTKDLNFEVFVTAEDSANISQPTGSHLLSARK